MAKRHPKETRTSIEIVRDYRNAKWRAEDAYRDVVKREFPVDSEVFYDHGDYERSGVVLRHSGGGLFIKTPHGAETWVCGSRVTRVCRREEGGAW